VTQGSQHTLKLSSNAASQLYPHLVRVTCEKHGEQPRTKVPSTLQVIFAKRDDPTQACCMCVNEAKEQWNTHQKTLRANKAQEKEDRRAAITDARDAAKTADVELADYIKQCKVSEETVKLVEQSLATYRSEAQKAKANVDALRVKLAKLQEDLALAESDTIKLSETSLSKFEELEGADADVTSCYNTLQEHLDKAEHLWDLLGKSVKKKRDKSNRRTAISLLREHSGKNRQDVDTSASGQQS